jgi:hypothetical protein
MVITEHDPLVMPLLGLDNGFPDDLFVLHHAPTNRYGCYNHQGTHGLACFSSQGSAFRFGEYIDLDGLTIMSLTFDEAREVAKERPMPVVSMMLLDNMSDPIIHYIR